MQGGHLPVTESFSFSLGSTPFPFHRRVECPFPLFNHMMLVLKGPPLVRAPQPKRQARIRLDVTAGQFLNGIVHAEMEFVYSIS
jgi:hypothetical protein